jgi:hypothetical protein
MAKSTKFGENRPEREQNRLIASAGSTKLSPELPKFRGILLFSIGAENVGFRGSGGGRGTEIQPSPPNG